MRFARYLLLFLIATRAGADILFNETRLEEGGFSIGALVNVIAISLFLFSFAARRLAHAKLLSLIWGPYLLIAAASLSYSSDVAGGTRLLFSTLTLPAIFGSMLLLIRTEDQVVSVFKTIIYSSIATSGVAFYQLATGGLEYRIESTLNHANIFAFYILAVLVALLYYLQVYRRRLSFGSKLLLYGYATLQLVFLLLTQTRNAWAAAVVLAAFYAIGVNRKLLLAAPIIPLVLLLPPIADRLSDVETNQAVTYEEVQKGTVILNSYVWRKKLWDSALADSSGDRWFGKGFNSFHYNSAYFFPLVNADSTTEAHSGYVQTIYETGIMGLLAYVWLYVGVAFAAIARRQGRVKQTWLICAFVAVNLVINYADNIPYYLPFNWYVWAIFGADLSLRYSSARQTPRRLRRVSASADATTVGMARQAASLPS